MDAELNMRLNYELKMLEATKNRYSSRLKSLADCKGTFLRRSRHKGSEYYYYIKRPGSSGYRYIGREKHVELARVKEARFLEESIKRIDKDIEMIRSLANGYQEYDLNSVNDSLPKLYRSNIPSAAESSKTRCAEWIADRLAFQKEFPENYPEYKKHSTSDGVMVKSISEVVLYERFKAAGFAQIYELPLPMNDYGPPLYPDFTILSPIDFKTEILVEFVGRLDLREYRDDFARKVGRYMANGYIPGVNLFFIFSKSDGSIDSTQITKVINDIRGLA